MTARLLHVWLCLWLLLCGAEGLRKCCRGAGSVLALDAAAREVQCEAPQSPFAPFVWPLQEWEVGEPSGAGPPPGCTAAAGGRVFAWVLQSPPSPAAPPLPPPSPFPPSSQKVGQEVLSPPEGWREDESRFCADVLVLKSSSSESFLAVALGCVVVSQKGAEAADWMEGEATDWRGGELVWSDAASEDASSQQEGVAPWSRIAPAAPSSGAEATVALHTAALRKCCPRGQGVHVGRRTCVPLPEGHTGFPSRSTLRSNHTHDAASSAASVVVVGAAEALVSAQRLAEEVQCPKHSARVFERAARVVLVAARNDSSEEGDARWRSSCVDAAGDGAGGVVVARCEAREVACGGGRRDSACVSKCCPLGFSFVQKRCRRSPRPLPLPFKQLSFVDAPPRHDVALFEGKPSCKEGFFPLSPAFKADDAWQLQRDGRVFRPIMSRLYLLDGYCMESLHLQTKDGNSSGVHAFVCFPSQEDQELVLEARVLFPLRAAVLLLSAVALALVLCAYTLLPPLRNLHGKTVMAHSASQLGAFVCLATAQIMSLAQLRTEVCKAIGYTLLFWLLSNFSWLNVLCFDIWWTFGALRGRSEAGGRAGGRARERRRFLLYSAYAWGLPLVLAAVAVTANEKGEAWGLHFDLRPNIAVRNCFLVRGTTSRVLYLQIPAGLMVSVNALLFALTARRCHRVKAEMARLTDSHCSNAHSSCHSNGRSTWKGGGGKAKSGRDEAPTHRRMARFRADCERFLMNAKLFVAMGVPWVLDVVSDFIIEPAWVWYVPEALLSLQGVFIFCIFVLKRKVLVRMRRRLADCSCCCCCCALCSASGQTEPNGASGPQRSSGPQGAGPFHAGLTATQPKQVQKSCSSSTLCTMTTSCGGGGELITLRQTPSPPQQRIRNEIDSRD